MSRHRHLPIALAALISAAGCSAAAGDELTAPTIDTTTTTTTEATQDAPPADDAGDSVQAPEGNRTEVAVAVAIDFVEESEAVATATPEQIEEILSPYLHHNAPPALLDNVLAETAENQELGLTRWRHAVVETRVEELADGDVIVELWQVAIVTLERGSVQSASLWATDTLTLTYTAAGWKITDRVMQRGPTPGLAPALIADAGETIESRLTGFGDAHPPGGQG